MARRALLSLVLSVVPTAPLSFAWWRAWIYAGWPGPPGFLGRLVHADGEAAYNLVHLEMFLVLLVVAFPIVLWALGRATASVVRVLSLAGFVLFLIPALLLAGEALYVGLLASSVTVAEYHFGSESMVGHGGWAYRSRLTYLAHGLLWSGALGILAAFLAANARRARREAAV